MFRRVIGLILFCIGIGMLIVMTMPVGLGVLAVLLTSIGLFLATRRC